MANLTQRNRPRSSLVDVGDAVVRKVFISHSVQQGDELLLTQLCAKLKHHDIVCHVAARNWKFGASLTAQIEDEIRASELVLALVTREGRSNAYVHQELGIAQTMTKRVMLLVEKGAAMNGLQPAMHATVFDLAAPSDCADLILEALVKAKAERKMVVALHWALLAFLADAALSRR